jgi:hypothetical protein
MLYTECMSRRAWTGLLCFFVIAAGILAACGSTGGNSVAGAGGFAAAGGTANGGSSGSGGTGIILDAGGDAQSSLVLSPQNPVVVVKSGQPVPTVHFQVTENGKLVSAQWLVNRAEIGAIDANGVFTPTGQVAGTATVQATVGSRNLSTTVTVQIQAIDIGGTETQTSPGPGGYEGVGGEGIGSAPTPAVQGVLQTTPTADPNMKWLYPYDKTVFPLGLLAPLLQWTAGPGAVADGILIHLSTKNYDYKGYFGRPAALPAGQPFVRHPIPQAAWDAATRSAAGGTLTVELIVAAGGTAYGPILETWTIANGDLKGTVYYQSYGTNLAHNYSATDPHGNPITFGGATLAIKPGATAPTLVAGNDSECRVCHSVSADGSRMIVQHGDDYPSSSSYDLKNGYTETAYPGSTRGLLGWIGMYPDGSIGLSNAAPLPGGANTGNTNLYDLTTGAAIPTTGLTTFVTQAGLPAFSPDGKHVAFDFYAGPGNATTGAGDNTKLVVMDFDKASDTFSNPRVVYTGHAPGWPSFMPTNDSVVFEVEVNYPGPELFATRNGAEGELWWTDLATGTAHALDEANGMSGGSMYLPTGPNNHATDTEVNYEPTISPIPSGGYAWMVLTSRRLYGSVATVDPWCSDPRSCDLSTAVTPKKLWVAAIDLNAKAGTDPSHPAFYLPAQELQAGNSRGFWVVDPCKADGSACDSGDQCCGGYCQADPKTGALTCGSKTNKCSNEYDHCTTAADCCDQSLQCINNTCSVPAPPH